MTEIVNTGQSATWNGYDGGHWADNEDRYDGINGGFNESLLSAAQLTRHDRVLDIGCGNGQLTRRAARRAVSATGIDLSEPMLAVARGRAAAEQVDNVEFVHGDAQVHAFPAGAFDVAVSRFGVMFFADPVAAFTTVARALRPGGRLAFVSLPPLEDSDIGLVFEAAAPYLPAVEAGHRNSAFAFPDATTDVLTSAGFEAVEIRRIVADSVWGCDPADAANFIIDWGPMRHRRGLCEFATDTQVRAALTAALEQFARPDGVHLDSPAWLVTATARR
ncbi:class I SAM-dependent methyltransferase [Nocardia bovistercoris]|uniref:Methyltransferase domain-containing protein n=1 Tax=Nocardia bovistercoris TaxID=2785916 RepID=A0A931IDK5_9NOCA|nr:class I SAM-dependent methyltransferase [Nocardia bovistercoris]MBH0779216.1 methyltransferase domain-containing protein [Nocardia bovistercoris]